MDRPDDKLLAFQPQEMFLPDNQDHVDKPEPAFRAEP